MNQQLTAKAIDDYVAWCCYKRNHDGSQRIVTCDSDAEGAFRVYRQSRWIPVAERLPTHCYDVVVWVVDGSRIGMLDVGIYVPDKNRWQSGRRMEDGSIDDTVVEVTHWMEADDLTPVAQFRDCDQQTPGGFMQGTRTNKPPYKLEPGEYCRADTGAIYACTPNGLLANLSGHSIVEHEDGTISAAPSIAVKGNEDETWHGYLERGVWRVC